LVIEDFLLVIRGRLTGSSPGPGFLAAFAVADEFLGRHADTAHMTDDKFND